jgi:deoxyribose-phosphate aldolase
MYKEILTKVDHTLLLQGATLDEIKNLIDEGEEYGAASVCIPPCYVLDAAKYRKTIKICTVIGFPNGNSTTAAKCFEAEEAVKCGADEIDMVINIGKLKEKDYQYVLDEINSVKASISGKLLKVIIETCLLTDEEKIKMCQIVEASQADYIKTSTGFSTGGATREDIILFKQNIKTKKIKAAGGIKSIDDAREFIELGASRLGTSRIIKILKENKDELSHTAY